MIPASPEESQRLKSESDPARDAKFWRRILLLGLTGAVPLFAVSLLLIKTTYSDGINFSLQERRGIVFQRPLEQLLDLLPQYEAAVRQGTAANSPIKPSLAELQSQIDVALTRLAGNYNSDLGRVLKFTDADLALRQRDNARLSVLLDDWNKLKMASPAVAASGDVINAMTESIQSMIANAGDASNLILDDKLDSYYLMEITVALLPQAQQQVGDITLKVAGWLRGGQIESNKTQIAVMAAMLRRENLNRVVRDAQTSLGEDKIVPDASASLQKNLPPAVEKFQAATRSFLGMLDRLADGKTVPLAEFEAAGWNAHAECYRTWQTGADELDQLLDIRIHAIKARRLQCYLVIVFTFGAAATIMIFIMRALLAAHHAGLLETAATLRAIGDNLPNGMVFQVLRNFDGTTRFLYVSAGIERLNGLSAEAVQRDMALYLDQIIEEDRPKMVAARQASLANNGVFQVTIRMRRADGRLRWMQLSSTPHRLPDGRVVWNGIATDVTEQREAEQRIQQLNRVYAVLSDINQTIVREKDGKAVLEAACRIAVEKGKFRMAWIGMLEADAARLTPVAAAGTVEGYTDLVKIDLRDQTRANGPAGRAVLSGRHTITNDIEHDADFAPWREEALRRGYRSSGCFPLKLEDKVVGIFNLYASEPDFFSEEELALLDELAMDIGFALESQNRETKRQAAEAALKHSEERFSRIFNGSPMPATLSRFDDGVILDVNEGFLRLSGFAREEVIGHTALELGLYADASQRSLIMEQLQKYGRLHGLQQILRQKSGELRQTLLWFETVTIGGEMHYVVMSLDITEQKKAEQRQRQLENQLRQAQKLESLGTLAGGIAHDFNNILCAISSFTEVSKMENPGNAGLQENLGEVIKASKRATNLVRQILLFSRQQKSERKRLRVSTVVNEVLKLLKSTLPSTIKISHDEAPNLPDVMADASQIHQIMMNLCANAAHAMRDQHGSLTIHQTLFTVVAGDALPHPDLSEGDYIKMTVSDTGHGMDAATMGRIFEPFFTTKGPGEGTGLGLATVHGIVKDHNGVITVESEVGKGTTFTIYLPAIAPGVSDSATGPDSVPLGRGERILFVDDEEPLCKVTGSMLKRLGYLPVVFQSSLQAWQAIQKEPAGFAVVVSDLTMPDMTGLELAERIRSTCPKVPVLLTSGFREGLTPATLLRLNIQAVLEKPIGYKVLAQAIHQALNGKTPPN